MIIKTSPDHLEVLTDLGIVVQALKMYYAQGQASGYFFLSSNDRTISDMNHSRALELIEYYETNGFPL